MSVAGFCQRNFSSKNPWKSRHDLRGCGFGLLMRNRLLMEEIPNNNLECINPVNNGTNYQPQLVFTPENLVAINSIPFFFGFWPPKSPKSKKNRPTSSTPEFTVAGMLPSTLRSRCHPQKPSVENMVKSSRLLVVSTQLDKICESQIGFHFPKFFWGENKTYYLQTTT